MCYYEGITSPVFPLDLEQYASSNKLFRGNSIWRTVEVMGGLKFLYEIFRGNGWSKVLVRDI